MTPADRAHHLLTAHARHVRLDLDGLFMVTQPHGDQAVRHVLYDGTGKRRGLLTEPLARAWIATGRETIAVRAEAAQSDHVAAFNERWARGEEQTTRREGWASDDLK